MAKLAGWSVIGASITWRVRVVGSPARAPTAARRHTVALAGIVGMRGIAAQIVRAALVGKRLLRGVVSPGAVIVLTSNAGTSADGLQQTGDAVKDPRRLRALW
jgi:hypothetical protein